MLACVNGMTCRWHACRPGDNAPGEMEIALRGASIVLVVVTRDFMRSKHCLDELHWACDEMQRRSQQVQQGQQPAVALMLVPVFYHDQDEIIGFGVDRFERKKLHDLLCKHHNADSGCSTADRAQWLDALMILAKRTGIRQDSMAR